MYQDHLELVIHTSRWGWVDYLEGGTVIAKIVVFLCGYGKAQFDLDHPQRI